MALPADLGGLALGGTARTATAAYLAGAVSTVAFLRRAMPGVIDDEAGIRRHMPDLAAAFDALASVKPDGAVIPVGMRLGEYVGKIADGGVAAASARGIQRELMAHLNATDHAALVGRSSLDARRRILGGSCQCAAKLPSLRPVRPKMGSASRLSRLALRGSPPPVSRRLHTLAMDYTVFAAPDFDAAAWLDAFAAALAEPEALLQ